MVNAWSLLHDELYGDSKMSDEKHSEYYYDYDRNDPNRPNPFVDEHGDVRYPADHPSQQFWQEDGFSLTGNPAPASPDIMTFSVTMPEDYKNKTIYESPDKGETVYARKFGQNSEERILIKGKQSTSPTNVNGFWKYEEDKTLKEVEEYLASTYNAHYTSEQSKTQTLDLIESIGDAEAFTRSNAIKYLSRFGKKNGKSKMDILKAIHYCILLYHFAGLHKKPASDFPY